MKVLITGANGLLGQKLVALFERNPSVQVVATGKGSNRNPSGSYTYVPLDITSDSQVQSIMNMVMPDVVINTAAMTKVDECESKQTQCWELNVRSLEHLIKACESNSVFLIHLSTDFVFDGENGPYKESDPVNPLSYYAKSKLASEELLRKSHIKWAIVRTQLVIGVVSDMSRSNIVLWVKENLKNEKPIQVVNDQWRTPTLAEDLARGCALIAEKRKTGVFHISGEDLLTPFEMAIETAHFFKLNSTLIKEVDGSVFTQPAKRPKKTGFILDKARKELGYQPRTFREALQIIKDQLHEI